MIRRLLTYGLFLLLALPGKAQQFPLYSQYLNHPIIINPAFSGFKNYNPLRFTSRQQWVGIEGAPSTQVLSLSGRIGRADYYNRKGMLNKENKFDNTGNIIRKKGASFSGKDALGILIYNDHAGAINKSGVQLSYAYHTKVNKIRDRFNRSPNISVSGSVTLTQFTLNEEILTLYDQNDPLIDGNKELIFIPDIVLGTIMYTEDYFLGLSGVNLIQPKIRLNGSNSNDNKLRRHYFLVAGYKYEAAGDLFIEPSILVKATEYSPFQIDLTTRFVTKSVSAGITYRTNKDICVMVGFKSGKYFLAYSFDYSFGNIIQYSNGSHEITIGYNFGEPDYNNYAF